MAKRSKGYFKNKSIATTRNKTTDSILKSDNTESDTLDKTTSKKTLTWKEVIDKEFKALLEGKKILHTSHTSISNKEFYLILLKLLNDNNMKYKTLKALGSEYIELSNTGGRIDFRTRTTIPTRTSFLGMTIDLLVIDEAEMYTAKQEQNMTLAIDRGNTELIFCYTSNRNPKINLTDSKTNLIDSNSIKFNDLKKQIENLGLEFHKAEKQMIKYAEVNEKLHEEVKLLIIDHDKKLNDLIRESDNKLFNRIKRKLKTLF